MYREKNAEFVRERERFFSCIYRQRDREIRKKLHREIISLFRKAQRQIRYSRGSSTRYTVKCIKIKYNSISYIRYQFHFIDSKSIHIPLFRSSVFSRNRYWYSTYSNVHSRIYISVKWNRNFSFQFRIL
jgi:hypothetical protein